MHHKQSQLFAQLSVVALFRLFHHGNVSFQLVLLCKSGCIQSGQHLVMFVASPVCTCKAHDLECLTNFFGAHQVRTCAQVYKFALLIEADFFALRQIFNQFYFIRLFFLLHKFDCFLSGQSKALDL